MADEPINPPPGSLPFPGAGPPPPGVIPNLVNPPTIGHKVEAAGWALWTVALFVVSLRTYASARQGKGRLGWDNVLIIVALILALSRIIILTVEVEVYGMGRHIWDLPIAWTSKHRSLLYIADMIYLIAMMCAKLSILLIYLRLFGVYNAFRFVAWGMMAVIVVYSWTVFFVYAFSCNPVYWAWHVTLDEAWNARHCINFLPLNTAMGAVNIATDVVLLMLPLRMVWKVQMRTAQKLGLTLVFGTGLFTVAAACVREYFVVSTEKNSDQSYTEVPEALWLTIELMVGIVAASLPAIGPLYQHIIRDSRLATSIRNLISRVSSIASRSSQRSPRRIPSAEGRAADSEHWGFSAGSTSDVGLAEMGRSEHLREITVQHAFQISEEPREDSAKQ
ncbi:hypothetical protein VTN77DRAFT_5622 [Rasamsonia byssochlamydoides]|uniref:uncharacterized protein n=1 Tax=Rasamsonia byssochlamydoides TaxID=89139 RepID=UPI003743C0CA